MRHSGAMEPRTLHDVLATVDATILRAAAGDGNGRPVEISDVAILDWTDPDSLGPGMLVLAVGVEPDRPAAATLIDRAARAGAAGVVVRCDGELPAPLRSAAAEAGLALLTAPDGVAWGQLYALMRTALASSGPPADTGASGIAVGDLFALADAIAAAVGGPITIEDPQFRVLAYSNLDQEIDEPRRHTILGRTPPPEWQARLEEAGVNRALRLGPGVVRFEAEGLAPRLAAPIRAGGELLGSIWLAESDRPLPDTEDQLVRAAELSAMHLLAHRASEDVKRRARGASVREILEGRVPAGQRQPPAPLCVVAFEAHPEHRDEWRTCAERILSVVSLFAEAAHREAICALVDERVWALVPAAEAARDRGVDLATRVVSRVDDVLGLRAHAVVGPEAAAVREVPASRAAVERALAVVERRPESGPVVHVDDVRCAAILHELLELAAERPSLRRGPLGDLGEGGAAQLVTLRAYLDAHGDVGKASKRLAVHPNTLRYRLRRLVDVAGLDLDDPDERLVTELQLRLLERDGAPAG
jgi:PucR C-terminal helix-turn-helix domain/Purine catabolism regulatory protein-like family/GGDEF-like domain